MPRKLISKKRRIRSPHPGVKLRRRELPSGHVSWAAVFVDPDTRRETLKTLDPIALPTQETRVAWCKQKSEAIAVRKMELSSGAPRRTRTALSTAIDEYFAAHETTLRPRTVQIYRHAADKLITFCTRHGIGSVDDLTRPVLFDFKESLAAEKKRAPKRKGKRGLHVETSRKRSAASVNQELRAVHTVLGYLRKKDKLTRLTSDDLSDGLELVKGARELPEFLRAEQCRKLLEAALRHDAETHLITRDEHRGLRAAGTTSRFDPIAPFITFCLLSGCRFGEAVALRWSAVHLDALDAEGRKVGEIHLRASATKTGHARVISLDVTPGLRALLAAMKLRAGKSVYVFGDAKPLRRDQVEAARKRLTGEEQTGSRGKKRTRGPVRTIQTRGFGAPEFSWQKLRSTCATVSCNAPSMFGDAAVFKAAKRLGHSVMVSEKRYAGLLAVSREARTLEAAMQVDDLVSKAVERIASPEKRPRLAVVREVRA